MRNVMVMSIRRFVVADATARPALEIADAPALVAAAGCIHV
jgi:hypothetical protein